jgi:hypothetical protein
MELSLIFTAATRIERPQSQFVERQGKGRGMKKGKVILPPAGLRRRALAMHRERGYGSPIDEFSGRDWSALHKGARQ